jgi:hypothetical protein
VVFKCADIFLTDDVQDFRDGGVAALPLLYSAKFGFWIAEWKATKEPVIAELEQLTTAHVR